MVVKIHMGLDTYISSVMTLNISKLSKPENCSFINGFVHISFSNLYQQDIIVEVYFNNSFINLVLYKKHKVD